jgi:hypothetical protein
MMEAERTSETSVDIQLRTRQYIPEDSELHTRRRENLKSHIVISKSPLLLDVNQLSNSVINTTFQYSVFTLNNRMSKLWNNFFIDLYLLSAFQSASVTRDVLWKRGTMHVTTVP